MIKRSLLLVSAAALLAPSAPAAAQSVAQRAAPGTALPAPPDRATLAEARLVVAHLVPNGAYRTIMHGMTENLVDTISNSMKDLPIKEIAEVGGLSDDEAKALDKVDVSRFMAIYDPHWQERMQVTMRAMFESMGDFFDTIEPDMREAMATAYAHQFTLSDLQDLDRYFSTPVGAKFSERYLTIMSDPAMIAATKSMMPKMMAQMPKFLEAAKKATAALPPPRKIEDMSDAERAELAKALGIDVKQLKDPKTTS